MTVKKKIKPRKQDIYNAETMQSLELNCFKIHIIVESCTKRKLLLYCSLRVFWGLSKMLHFKELLKINLKIQTNK